MMRAARPALTIDVIVSSELWKDAGKLEATVRRAATRAAATQSTRSAELAIVLTDDSAIRALNRDWRGVDKATNVLAFPTKNAAANHLGDIVLARETIAREARSERKPLAHHLAHLASMAFCIWSDTITHGPRTRLRWNALNAKSSANSLSRTHIGQLGQNQLERGQLERDRLRENWRCR